MKLYGNLNNRLMESSKQPEPQVGMGATLIMYSNRRAGTIIHASPNYLTVQRDIATRTDSNGMSECQDYSYQPNPDGSIAQFKKNKNGRWQEVSLDKETRRYNLVKGGYTLLIGDRDEYYDFSF